MRFKKILSVFLAAVLTLSAFSLGLTAVAAEIDYDAQYRALALALQNEHVRELTNYTITNNTLDNGTEGFDQEARGFAYDHRVVAKDNASGDILKASNRFYYIAESIMSYTYGVGCYDASTLISYISEKIKPYFISTENGEVIYEDFYGERYYPTPEEVEKYNNTVALITSVGGEVNQATLTEFEVYFIAMDDWQYYNVDTIFKYFMGNVLKINVGNWYHRFSFIVETSVDSCLEESGGINNIANPILTIRTAIYQIEYNKFYNETASKAYFAFAEPSLERVWNSFGEEFNLDRTSADLTKPVDGLPGLTREGQASGYMIKISYDDTTVPYLTEAYQKFTDYIRNYNVTKKWDEGFVSWSDDTVRDHPDTHIILGYAGHLANNYSNDTLLALFGDTLGNMVTLAYLFKTNGDAPTRTVRGTATYTATPDKLNEIIYDLDALVSPREGEDNSSDLFIANRVARVVSMFFDTTADMFVGTPVYGMEYTTLQDLIGKLLQALVFRDSIVNMLVEMLYPMIVNLLEDTLGNLTGVGFLDGAIQDILNDVIKDNKLAIYPDALGNLLIEDYGDKYAKAAQMLKNAGSDWKAVNFDALTWGVDEAPLDGKDDTFIDALCAGLGGFTRLLVCFLCGDENCENGDRDKMNANFGKYYDLKLIPGLSGWLVAQGLYTKLFIPLYRVLGIPQDMYLTTEAFHAEVDKDFKNCLKLAVTPVIKFITNVLAKKPFETLMKLVPNLVHFLSRKGTQNLDYADDWANPSFVTGSQDECHKGFDQLQTYSLWGIMENVHVAIVAFVGAKIWSGSIASFLSKQSGMLSSLNALLDEIIKFEYETGNILEEGIACYSDGNGNIVLPNSEEYGLNPGKYPVAHTSYWADASNTKFTYEKTEETPFYHDNLVYEAKNFYIPAIPEAKLISTGEVYAPWNTIDVQNPGLVLQFLLRYVFSAVGYRYNDFDETLPTVIECLGISLEDELFMGLSLGDIVYNIMLHPDEAICAVLELFYSNETGDLYSKKPYTYPVEPIDYHETTLLNTTINPTLTYGAEVKYSKYWTREYANDFVSNLGPLVEDILIMFGVEGMEEGLGAFLENMLNDMVFSDDLVNTLFNTIYQLIGSLKESLGIDIEEILAAVLDVSFNPTKVSRAIVRMMGFETPASRVIAETSDWLDLFTIGYHTDPVTGETSRVIEDVTLDWNIDTAEEHGLSKGDAFLRTVSALLSPAAFLIKFLFMDYDLDILGLVKLNSYAGYQYAFIGLLEALSCPDILTYDDYYEASLDPECGEANTIYYLFYPLLGLLEKVYADPVNTLLSLIPNLLFFISIGGLNDLINNLVHFAYVLLDILKPVVNAYDLLEGLLSNIEISGLTLNLALPLDIDVNSLVSDLLGALVGDVLTIEGVSLHLPYIDLYTLCVGTVEKFTSKEVRSIVHLNSAGGGELLTALLRIVFEVLFMDENHQALSEIISNLAGEGKLDAYDEETLYMVIDGLFELIEENEVLDIVIYAVYMLITKLVPIADTLAPRFAANGMTIGDLLDSAADMDVFVENIGKLLKDPNAPEVPGQASDMNAISSLLNRLMALFEKIKLFFAQLFPFLA